MSRTVPLDQSLSDDDRAYLHARGEHARVAQLDELYPAEVDDEDEGLGGETLPDGDDYDDTKEWKVADLQEELVKRGLSKDGKRDELITRLREDDVKAAEQGL